MNLPAISGSRFSTRLLVFALSSIVLTSDLFAQRFQILDVSRNADGKVIIRFEANTNSYYILYRADALTEIFAPIDLGLGAGPQGSLTGPASLSFTSFLRVLRVPLASPLDTDGDGMNDLFELRYPSVLRPLDAADALGDPDQDNLSNFEESLAGSDPGLADTDKDGLLDGDEIKRATNPLLPDSDGDGWNDESEVTGQGNPLDARIRPRITIGSAPSVGITLAQITRADLTSLRGGSYGVTVAQPLVAVGLPSLSLRVGAQPNTVVAQPVVSVGLPQLASGEGMARSVTVAVPPVAVVLPAIGGGSTVKSGTTIAQPPTKVRIGP
ncbi:MAG: hypothetical protein FJ403_19160 [Verrucomicrobia bacterium]|nr:hypothetical protein [Verrucomicrobiota bacterium]